VTDHVAETTLHVHAAEIIPALAWGAALNAGYVVFELGFGFFTGSLALLADAAHNLTDVAGLLVALGAAMLARRTPTPRHTYGLGQATVLAALANAITILIGVGAIWWEAVHRFRETIEVPAGTVLWVAMLGIAVNGGTALLFLRSRHSDLNARGAFLHMASDTAVSAGVVGAAAIILATGWLIIDPIAALAIGASVAWSSFGLLKSALHLSLAGVPETIAMAEVEQWLQGQPGVTSVHDLHIWPLSTTAAALTAHLVMPEGHSGDSFLDGLADELSRRFGIAHTTLQVEHGDRPECRLAPSGGH
jgi:cobalt-zinc-cadmium efflux system protein